MTANPRERISRVRSFDHGSFGAWPEYVAAQKALNALALALDRNGEHPGGRQDWLDLAADMASALSFSDACPERHDSEDPDWSAAPWKVDRNGTSLRCHYFCPTHRNTWTCGYSTEIVRYM